MSSSTTHTMTAGTAALRTGTAAGNLDPVLLIARILLVAIFPISAWYKITGWPGIVTMLTQQGVPMPLLGGYIAIGMEMIAALLVIIGLWTRWAAIALILYVIGATIIAHRFWEFTGPAQFNQMMQFMKSLCMIGGLLLIAVIGPGRYAVQPRP